MKQLVILISLLILEQSHAQGSLYIRPKFEVRTNMTSTFAKSIPKASLFNFNYTNYVLQNPYMDVKIPRMSFFNGLNIGLNIGWKFNNGSALEIGWNQDATGSELLAYGWSDQSNIPRRMSFGKSFFKSYVLSERFELNYIKKLIDFETGKRMHVKNVNFHFGTGFKFTSSALRKKEPLPTNPLIYTAGGTKYGTIETRLSHIVTGMNRVSPFFTLGISTNVTYGKKHIANIMLSYTQGMKFLESTYHYMNVYDDGSFVGTYLYKTYSRGSGLQLQISRNFNLYPKSNRERKTENQ